MSILDPERAMKALEERTIEQVEKFFPMEGRTKKLVATKVYAGKGVDVDDIASQKKARLRGRTWSVPIYADFSLVDKETGTVVDSVKKLKLIGLPKITRRFSYIVDGTEYQSDNQWRLKSGVYSRVKANGGLEAQFNLSKGRGFRMAFSPEKKRFMLNYGTTNIQLLPVLQAMGVSDEEIRSVWGESLYAKSVSDKKRGELVKLAKSLDRRFEGKTDVEATPVILDKLKQTELRKDTTEITLGAPFSKVEGGTLLAASDRLLAINKGDREPDNRDSLRFKELWSIEDHLPERILNSSKRIEFKIKNNLDRKDSVKSIVTPDIFNVPVKAYFTSTSLSQQPNQTNPIDMVGGFLRTTILGTGGISSDLAISDDAKLIDSSHLGFLDPIHTPEGKRSGISGHLSLGVSKIGNNPTIRVFSTASGKYENRSPADLSGKAVAFPDQYIFGPDGRPHPKTKSVTVVDQDGGDPRDIAANKVDYVLQSPKQLFSMTANLVPFLPSDQANRAGMATRHMEQAISLKYREEPLVQVVSGNPEKRFSTWEKVMGGLSAHTSPVSGIVSSVGPSKIVVSDSAGKKHEIALYESFPLNEKKSFMQSTPIVTKGAAVKAGQTIADTNFTRNGTLSLGTNLRVGYVPYKGLVFEDGIVISEAAAERLTSEHLHKPRVYVEKNMALGLKKFRANYPGAVSEENAAKMDEDGVIKKGQKVSPGDVLIAALQKSEPSKEQILLKGIHRSLARPYKDRSVSWEKPYSGVVTDVVRNGREVTVFVKTEEPADIGDKLTGRHGNKGVITAVVPNEEMPKNSEGVPLEIIFNPSGVPGRINLGQVLETSLAKAAAETGEPYAVENFQSDDEKKVVKVKEHYRTIKTKSGPKRILVKEHERELGYQEVVKSALKDAGVDETEELFDPVSGKSLGKVLVGQQYILKMTHQVDKKLSARAHGYGYDYSANMIPKSGGGSGGQRFGELGLYAMLAHGATANIRDALTYKGDKSQDEVWTAVQTGQMLPTPKPSFAYEKFLAYLAAIGVNVEKEGNGLVVQPLTDKQILSMSNGEIKNGSRVIRGKDLKPEKDGLFDEEITGGPGGKSWSHLTLPEKLPNPVFEKSVRSLLGITGAQYDKIISGEAGLSENGYDEEASLKGPAAIAQAISKINVAQQLAAAEEDIKTARKSKLDAANKKIKYLRMLDKNSMSAEEAYLISNVPILPPLFRPITAMEGGDLNVDGLNLLYRDIAILNNKLKEASGVLPDEEVAALRGDLYDAIDALMGTAPGQNQGALTIDGQAKPPGILAILSGRTSPKQSFFHQRLLDRRQDLAMRSVIVPNMELHLDELGLPRKGAMKIFRPFVVKELVAMGYTPLSAREEVEKNSSLANKALDIAVSKRPVLFKRDPVLHKFGIMAFKAKLHGESSVQIHPLVTGGFNADFDGDTMAVFVPVSQEAVDEAYKMLPSKNLFNPATGKVMYQPTLEGQMGLFLLTQMGKKTNKSYKDLSEARVAAKDGSLALTDVVTIDGKKTTLGRATFHAALPKAARTDKILTDPKAVMSSKVLQGVLRDVATKAPGAFSTTVDKLKDLGFGHSYAIGFSFSLDDFKTLGKLREKHLVKARKQESTTKKQVEMNLLSAEAAEAKIIKIYMQATEDINKEAKALLNKRGNKLAAMNNAGVKPSWSQLQQMVIAPMLLENAKGRVIPVPVTRSYSEGLDTSGYWVASSGARKGLIEKVQSVQKPGALNKQIANTAITYLITEDDCKTDRGIALDTTDADIVDRFTAKKLSIGGMVVPKNTEVTPSLLSSLKSSKVSKLLVRSPLKCQSSKGLCSKCYGLYNGGNLIEKGTNIGLIAGTSLGERGTQLAMKSFHTGGVAGASGNLVGGIDRVIQLLKMPEIVAGSAVLSPVTGTIKAVKKSDIGGHDVLVGEEQVYVPGDRSVKVKKGAKVRKGQRLTGGPINPRELLGLTNVDTVQRYLSDEIHGAYKSEGIKRRNVEVVTKSLTNLSRVIDPGDSDFVKNDLVSSSHVAHLNRNNTGGSGVLVEPVLRGVETLPLDQTTDWLARMQYRKLKETLIRAANEGWESDIHGLHPSPGITYSAEFGKGREGGTY